MLRARQGSISITPDLCSVVLRKSIVRGKQYTMFSSSFRAVRPETRRRGDRGETTTDKEPSAGFGFLSPRLTKLSPPRAFFCQTVNIFQTRTVASLRVLRRLRKSAGLRANACDRRGEAAWGSLRLKFVNYLQKITANSNKCRNFVT